MKASKDAINKNNILICMIAEYRGEEKQAFDCHITSIEEKGINANYLSGYRSRNDFVPWKDIVAKVDKRKKIINLKDMGFRGKFEVFDNWKKVIE
jgi:hypothetical protein